MVCHILVSSSFGAHLPFYSMGTEFFSSGVKRPERGDLSALSSSEVNNEWGSITTPSLCLHGISRGDFAFIRIVRSAR